MTLFARKRLLLASFSAQIHSFEGCFCVSCVHLHHRKNLCMHPVSQSLPFRAILTPDSKFGVKLMLNHRICHFRVQKSIWLPPNIFAITSWDMCDAVATTEKWIFRMFAAVKRLHFDLVIVPVVLGYSISILT